MDATAIFLAQSSEMIAAPGLKLIGDGKFYDAGGRFPIEKKYPGYPFTFGAFLLRES